MLRVLHLYVDRFNRRDWDGLRELITADARLLVADRFAGPLADAPYFSRYERMTTPWRMTVGEIDGQTVVVILRHVDGAWTPHSIVSVQMAGDLITRVVDYGHCPWVLAAASSVVVGSAGHVSLPDRQP
jgi:RNA polymerase sigma-70 factor (ECF subfamily)